MNTAALPIYFLAIALLSSIDQIASLTTFENTFKEVSSVWYEKGRKEANIMLARSKYPSSPMEITEGIFGKRTSPHESGKNTEQEKTAVQLAKTSPQEDLRVRVYRKIYEVQTFEFPGDPRFPIGLSAKAENKMHQLFEKLWKCVSLSEIKLDGKITDQHSSGLSEEALTSLYENFEEFYTFFEQKANRDLNKLMFCLSDALVGYLSILEKHKLMDLAALKRFLNTQDHWVIIFNYVTGKFPSQKSITSLYLTYDFENDLKQSALTEEIHGLLALIDDNNWLKMEQLYLEREIKSTDFDLKQWKGFKMDIVEFEQIESKRVSQFTHHIELNIEALAAHLKEDMNLKGFTRHSLIHLKLLHRSIFLLIKCNMKYSQGKIITSLKKQAYYKEIEALDKGIKLFSDLLKVIYYKYAELVQEIVPTITIEDGNIPHLLNGPYLTGKSNIRLLEFEKKSKQQGHFSNNFQNEKTQVGNSKFLNKLTLKNSGKQEKPNEINNKIINTTLNPDNLDYCFTKYEGNISNKLDSYSDKKLIDFDSDEKTDKISTLLQSDSSAPVPASTLIKISQQLAKMFDGFQNSHRLTLTEKADFLKSVLENPMAAISPQIPKI
ncbi:hypothetical protein PGT21_007022 [Puccinia graminis f. sp. tritici]|uniref:Secreted protein n=1 Tax=Puccinia graminis f. sp. tritici TaxID=56615 RepID=A0A5B0QAP3_PUCGR|nr:hypothetical protein PGT21_007022 [Puccinia graminis f. sp. tritici]